MHDHHDDCGCNDEHNLEDDQDAAAEEENDALFCVSQFMSRNQNYKAAVYDLKIEPAKFEVAIYQWKDLADSDRPVWERVAGPIILDTLAAAETWGQQNLAVYAGEKLDTTVGDPLRSDVFAILGHENFDFLDPQGYRISFLESEDSEDFLPVAPVDKLLVAGQFYFVEYAGAWLAGFLYDEGEIRCWKKFDDLKSALLEITI